MYPQILVKRSGKQHNNHDENYEDDDVDDDQNERPALNDWLDKIIIGWNKNHLNLIQT